MAVFPVSIQKLLPHEQEAAFVKEALAKVTVETAKRMWPQRWDSFFVDLDTLSKCGVCSTFVTNIPYSHKDKPTPYFDL